MNNSGSLEIYVLLAMFLQHIYCVPYCTFCDSFKVKCSVSGAKTSIHYMTEAMLLLSWNRHLLLYFYYVASGMCCGGSEFKCPGAVAKKLMTYPIGK